VAGAIGFASTKLSSIQKQNHPANGHAKRRPMKRHCAAVAITVALTCSCSSGSGSDSPRYWAKRDYKNTVVGFVNCASARAAPPEV
jgi:hypothetical protein